MAYIGGIIIIEFLFRHFGAHWLSRSFHTVSYAALAYGFLRESTFRGCAEEKDQEKIKPPIKLVTQGGLYSGVGVAIMMQELFISF
ncbi:MAG: hypothetical protein CVU04_01255 [Bacteroidetes bacterium HGW-Bacteroidetes-20]|nr:MAG: hypothetical protein CVU04_01255 [Bacteroidetes bacterium HGW-Bacteroidetes-20]